MTITTEGDEDRRARADASPRGASGDLDETPPYTDTEICGRTVDGHPCLKQPQHPQGCARELEPHELGFWPDRIHGIPSPRWPWLLDAPIDQARDATEVLAQWRDHPGWSGPGAGLRLGIVHVIAASEPDPLAVTDRFATELAWTLVVAASESICDDLDAEDDPEHDGDEHGGGEQDARDEVGPVFTAMVLAGEPTTSTAPRCHADRWRPLTGHPGWDMTAQRAIAAVAHLAGLIDPPAARLLVLISDGRFGPDHLARVRRQTSTLHARGCGVLWLHMKTSRTDDPPADPAVSGPTVAETAVSDPAVSPPGARVLHLDPAAPVPGEALAAAALDAMNRADPDQSGHHGPDRITTPPDTPADVTGGERQ